jgi:hypothetical protein
MLLFGAASAMADVYPKHVAIRGALRSYATQFPEIVQHVEIGQSVKNRSIDMVIVENRDIPTHRKGSVFLHAAHHGNEKSSTFSVMRFLESLVYDAETRQLLDQYTFYMVPIINPDGYESDSRYNANGKDLNRDYMLTPDNQLSGTIEPETKAIADLMNVVPFMAAISYHSGMEGVLWPWGFTPKANPEENILKRLSKKAAKALGSEYFKQSFYDYPTRGEFIDFAYFKYKTMALTFEVSSDYAPKSLGEVRSIANKAQAATMSVLRDLVNIHNKTNPKSFRPMFAFEDEFLKKQFYTHH